jgi:hypothetical protein
VALALVAPACGKGRDGGGLMCRDGAGCPDGQDCDDGECVPVGDDDGTGVDGGMQTFAHDDQAGDCAGPDCGDDAEP